MGSEDVEGGLGQVLVLELQVVVVVMYLTAKAASGQAKAGCPGSCGSITIPYPFGTTPDCSLDDSFLIECANQTARVQSGMPILDISLDDHQLRVSTPIDKQCYKDQQPFSNGTFINTPSKFPVSKTLNKFTVVGCYTLGFLQSLPADQGSRRPFTTACVSVCSRVLDVENGTCTGFGCCQMPVPDNLIGYWTMVDINFLNPSKSPSKVQHIGTSFSPCGYSFVVEEAAFNFSSSHLKDLQDSDNIALPLVLDWAVGNKTCEEAKTNLTTYACQANHTQCHDSNNGPGYLCRCQIGFKGNPYLPDGCQDINECEVSNPCIRTASCDNLPGSVNCTCPKGHIGNGMRRGTGCTPIDRVTNQSLTLAVALGICACLLMLLIGGCWIYWGMKRRKLTKLKEKFFQQNGGILLKQQLSCHEGYKEMTKIFSTENLKKATNNYDETKVLGQGGNGTVYKGVLQDNKVVAIKKSIICDQSQIEQFINEVIVLSQINHRNVVKLLGCCLETEVPLLVYEFITNGTLSSHIHDKTQYSSSLSWEMRLKIAAETAGALAYLHSATCMPIIHRDVKTANILLDDNYTAKVSDFGASRLIPIDQTKLTTLVQGTFGYVDPEYFRTSQLTEKSDVYGFGVVLAELLTGKEAVFFDGTECRKSLAIHFVSSMKEDRLLDILDQQVKVNVNEETMEQLNQVASLANICLRDRGEERPTMKEVATKLEGLLN